MRLRSDLTRKNNLVPLRSFLIVSVLESTADRGLGQQEQVYRGVTVEAPYSYHMAGVKNWMHGFVIKIDDLRYWSLFLVVCGLASVQVIHHPMSSNQFAGKGTLPWTSTREARQSRVTL